MISITSDRAASFVTSQHCAGPQVEMTCCHYINSSGEMVKMNECVFFFCLLLVKNKDDWMGQHGFLGELGCND